MNFIGSFFSKIKRPRERESFPVGWLSEGKTLAELREYLHRQWGFGGNFSTHIDSGEVINWRKLMENGQQYHLRVYQDGEVRGHIEMSPEKNAISNITRGGQSESREEFIKFLGDFVSKRKYISNLVADLHVHNPDAEVIKNEDMKED